MQINLIIFSSNPARKSNILNVHKEIINELREYFTVNILTLKELNKLTPNDFVILLVTAGDIESSLIQKIEVLPHPLILLADDYDNSLSTTIEISSWIRHHGFKCEIIYGEKREIIDKLQLLYDCFTAQHSLIGTRIGVIGNPSSLLISSNVDYLLAKRRWGVEYIDIPIEEVFTRYNAVKATDVEEDVTKLVSRASFCKECTPDDLINAIRLYYAVRQICDDFKLKSLTLNCSKILEKIPVTGCLALSLLNDESIIAGCENDLQSIFTMIAAKAITDKHNFMVNLSHIDKKQNEIILSHSTVCTTITKKFNLYSHPSSAQSIAIKGLLPTTDVTIVRCGGECLDEYYVSSGKLIENTNDAAFFHTQVRIKLDTPVNYFFNYPLGNHHIVILGNYVDKLNKFFQANTCKKID